MKLELFSSKNEWNNLVLLNQGSFLQSWEWGRFKEKLGFKVWRMALRDKKEYLLFSQAIRYPLPLARSYFYLEGGPIFNLQLSTLDLRKLTEFFLKKVRKLTKEQKAIFLRMDPRIEKPKRAQEIFKKLNLKRSLAAVQLKDTLILDISAPQEKILKSFHQKTRYNIRLSQRKGIKTRAATQAKDLESFWNLIQKTNTQKGIRSFDFQYYKELFRLSQNAKSKLKVRLFLAYFREIPIAGLMLILWGKRATYFVGCSDYQYRAFMAPHLLQWEAIKTAKRLGAEEYDFWGIIKREAFPNETAFKRHPWYGITRFKMGFGGRIVSYPGTYDYPLSQAWYLLYKSAKHFKVRI